MTGWELGVAAAAVSAGGFGAADFLAGAAARRTSALPVAARVLMIGLGVMLLLALATGSSVSQAALVLGAIAGVASSVGLAALYQALARGGMGVTVGLSSVVVSLTTLFADAMLRGQIPTPLQLAGVGCALGATWIASSRRDQSGGTGPVLLALVAGGLFGVALIFLDRAAETSPLWGLAAARASGTVLIVALLWSGRGALRTDWRPVIGAGLLDAGASALFIGSFVLVPVGIAAAVSAAVTPLIPMALAWFLLRERVSRAGALAVGLACLGIALIALG